MARKLNNLALAYSLAAVSAGGMLLMGVFGYTGIYSGMVNAMMQWHMFFQVNPFGVVAGMVEGAIWGFISGYAVAWAYNKFD